MLKVVSDNDLPGVYRNQNERTLATDSGLVGSGIGRKIDDLPHIPRPK